MYTMDSKIRPEKWNLRTKRFKEEKEIKNSKGSKNVRPTFPLVLLV